jgi:hypothetical protein
VRLFFVSHMHHYLDLYLPMRFYSPGFGGAK